MKTIKCNIILLLIAAASISHVLSAQEITVAPAHVVCNYKLPAKLDSQIKSKLQRALTKYGVSSEIGASRFAIVPEIIINSEKTTNTIPSYSNVDFDFVLSLKDIHTGRIFATYSIQTLSKGTNKVNAITKGVSNIRLDNTNFSMFCKEAKDKILSYYSSNLNAIISKSRNAANTQNYEEALFILSEIPETLPAYDTKVLPLIKTYYTTIIDNIGESVLMRAKAAWAQNPNAEGAEQVAKILEDMPIGCSSTESAQQLILQVKQRVQTIDDRNFALLEQQLQNEHSERMQIISAAKQVAMAYAQNQPKTVTKVYLW